MLNKTIIRVSDCETSIEKTIRDINEMDIVDLLKLVTESFYISDGEELYEIDDTEYYTFEDFVNGLVKELYKIKYNEII